MSYTQLASGLPVLSAKVLSDRLAELTGGNLVARRTVAGFPSRTESRVSERGQRFRPLLVELYRTGLALRDGSVQSDDGDCC